MGGLDMAHNKNGNHRIFGLFADFEQAFEVIAGIRRYEVPGVTVDDVRIKSPIEHPEIEDVLGKYAEDVG